MFLSCNHSVLPRNLAVYKRPIGATEVNFDGSHANGYCTLSQDFFSFGEKMSLSCGFSVKPSKYTVGIPIGLLYTARFLASIKILAQKYIPQETYT